MYDLIVVVCLEFNFVRKVRTVYDFLAEKQCLDLMKQPEIVVATTAIVDRELYFLINAQ